MRNVTIKKKKTEVTAIWTFRKSPLNWQINNESTNNRSTLCDKPLQAHTVYTLWGSETYNTRMLQVSPPWLQRLSRSSFLSTCQTTALHCVWLCVGWEDLVLLGHCCLFPVNTPTHPFSKGAQSLSVKDWVKWVRGKFAVNVFIYMCVCVCMWLVYVRVHVV